MIRHRWQKLREHTYICVACATGKINAADEMGWYVTWKLPDGTTTERCPTPVCAAGKLTVERLRKCGLTQLVRG